MLLLLVISVFAVGIGFIVYLKRSESRSRTEKAPERPHPRAQDFLEFEDIQNGILILPGHEPRP